jgi:hypothetical protein
VDRISKSRTGEVSLDLTHFPVDALGRSLVALDVAAATGGGVLFSTTKSGISCDVNSSSDTTAATDDGQDLTGLPGDDAFDVVIPDTDFGSGSDGDGFVGGDGYGDGGSGSGGNADETLDDQGEGPPSLGVPAEGPYIGGTLTAPDVCEQTSIQWLRDGVVISGATGSGYTLGTIDAGTGISARIFCLDGNVIDSEVIEAGTINSPIVSRMWFLRVRLVCAGGNCVEETTLQSIGLVSGASSGGSQTETSTGLSCSGSGDGTCPTSPGDYCHFNPSTCEQENFNYTLVQSGSTTASGQAGSAGSRYVALPS